MSDLSLQIPSLNLPESEPVVSEEIPKLLEGESLASPFLAAIPEQDRRIVEKYIKDWDSGVTKKFQSIHDQYAPYKDLGEIDRIQKAMEIVGILEEDPQLFYENLAQLLEQSGEDMSFDNENEVDPPVSPPVAGSEIDPRDAQIADLKAAVENLTGKFQANEASRTEQQQIAELDSYIKNLHNTHGEFDEDWVLLQISRGTDPEEAIKSWNSMIEDRVSSSRKKAPPNIISGQGSIPGGQVDPSKFTPAQRKEYVAAMLSAAQ